MSRWVQFMIDDPRETGCRGFVLRVGRATFSFTWLTDRDDED